MSAKLPESAPIGSWESDLAAGIMASFGTRIMDSGVLFGQSFVTVDPQALLQVLSFLRDEWHFDWLVDLTAVDYPQRDSRFELVYTLHCDPRNERLRVKTRVAEKETAASVTDVYAGANWLEREVFDMFGIEFAGHPDLKRMLLPDEWTGHPLRKDYPILGMDQRWVKENLGIESGQ